MKNLISQVTSPRILANPGQIKIINNKNQTLSVFENNLEFVPEDHEHLKPENYLVINNPKFNIIFSGKYINEWLSKRRKVLSNNVLKSCVALNNSKEV